MTSIASIPATFSISWNGTQTVTFAIPIGFVAISGSSWNVNSVVSGTIGSYFDEIFVGVDTTTQTNTGNGAWNYSIPVTTAQLADINAAAGTNLSVQINWGNFLGTGTAQAVSSFVLTLVGTAPPPIFNDPTWGYGYQSPSTPNLGIGLSTPCGGVGVSNSGTNAAPAALTIVYNFGGVFTTDAYTINISYAGQSVTMAVDTSPDGSTWTNQYTGSIGSDHTGTFQNEQITYNFGSPQSAQYIRLSYKEVPQVAASSLMSIKNVILQDVSAVPVPTGGSYCSNTGVLTISGTLRYGSVASPGNERQNFPMSMFIKECCTPSLQPCSHLCNGVLDPTNKYCADGKIRVINTTTDCNGAFSFTVSGSILAIGVALGTWIPNPNFDCKAPSPAFCNGVNSNAWEPFILDTTSAALAAKCGYFTIGADVEGNGSATTGSPFGTGSSVAVYRTSDGSISDENLNPNNTPYICPGNLYNANCHPCNFLADCCYVALANGISYPNGPNKPTANTLTGSATLNLFSGCGSVTPYVYFMKDGLFYEVAGVYQTYTDGCGKTKTNLPSPSDSGFDWFNFVSVAISNWTTDCSPPINVDFTGPLGGTLHIAPGTKVPRLTVNSNIYPSYDGKLPTLCPQVCPVVGIQIQPPCTGTIPDRLQVDCYKSNVAIAWVTSGSALKTSVNRGSTQKAIYSYGAELWEAPYTVEATNADDIGMVFLPNESLYLTYLLSGTAKYRLNKQLGTSGAWTSASAPNPLVARHSGSCRGQDQAARVRALGTQSTDAVLEFSQCRDNVGANWTTPVTITNYAQGPFAGLIYTGNSYVCLYSLSSSTSHGIANGIYMTQSTDGGATWSAPFFTGQAGGQVNGICATSHGVLVAVTWANTGSGGYSATSTMLSPNNGVGWIGGATFANNIPVLNKPAVITSLNDNIYICWVSADTPQYVMSTDGGYTYY